MIRHNGRYRAKCICRKCSNTWYIPVDVEYGTTNLINNGDDICQECGMEAEEIEVCSVWG